MPKSAPFTYSGEATREISFPLGGIGTGSIGLSGGGRLIDWEILNRPAKGITNGLSHFAVKAEQNHPDYKHALSTHLGILTEVLLAQGDYSQAAAVARERAGRRRGGAALSASKRSPMAASSSELKSSSSCLNISVCSSSM